jgi:peptide deformylase
MILPIISYGQSVLRKKCKKIDENYTKLNKLISNMWETLYDANGCGLAAPQVDQPIKLFIVDSKIVYDSMEKEERDDYFTSDTGIMETFINAKIIERSDKKWTEKEGCLSIPSLSEEVERAWSIIIEYYDRDFHKMTKLFSGYTARVIQHEYDHTEGILYVDHLKESKLKSIDGELKKISAGDIEVEYKMKFKK